MRFKFGGPTHLDRTRAGELLVGQLFSWVAQIARFDLALHLDCGAQRKTHVLYGLYVLAWKPHISYPDVYKTWRS